MENFGNKLRKLRQKKGLSAKKLAQICNCSPSLVYNIEKGYNQPQPEFIAAVAVFFKVTSDYLLGIDDNHLIPEKKILDLYLKLDYQEKMVVSNLIHLLAG